MKIVLFYQVKFLLHQIPFFFYFSVKFLISFFLNSYKKKMKKSTTSTIEESDEKGWNFIYDVARKLKSKESSMFKLTLDKKGVYSLMLKILSKMQLPGSKNIIQLNHQI